MAATTSRSSVSIKSVAMPAEHGGWGFLSEPILLGLLLAPSIAGVGIGIAAAALFLLHQPAKIFVKDVRKGKMYERTRLARRFVALYGVIALTGMILALATAADRVFLIPLLLSIPLAGVQLAYELRNDGRSFVSEVVGALALAATAPAIALAAGLPLVVAVGAWVLLAMRIVPSIVYVRARIRLIHGKTANVMLAIGTHVIALVLGAVLWVGGLVHVSGVLGLAVLFTRAVYGLRMSKPVPAKIVGFQELFFGLAYAIVCALALVWI